MSETGPPKGMQTPNTGTHDAALAKKAQEARGSSKVDEVLAATCLLYTSPSPRDQRGSRMPSSA